MYKKMKNIVNKEVKKCKAEYYSGLINKNKGNPSELWKTFNEITSKKSNSTITSTEADGVLYTETNEIAQALNTLFSRIGTKLAAKIKEKLRLIASNSRKFFPPAFSRWKGNNKSFSFCSMTEPFVLKQLKTLKTNKAKGLDRISADYWRTQLNAWHLYWPDFLTGHLRQALFHRFWNVVRWLLYLKEAIVPFETITGQSQYSQPLAGS